MATVVGQHVMAAPHQAEKPAEDGLSADVLADLASALNAGKRNPDKVLSVKTN